MPRNVSQTWKMEWLSSPRNHLAKIVGGSSSINAALYFRTPDAYLDEIEWPYSSRDVTEG
jgi:cellobiose dehydrogenase (acceptor)